MFDVQSMFMPVSGMLSIFQGFFDSNLMGRVIVLLQLASSVVAAAVIIGKRKELASIERNSRIFKREFLAGKDVLDYYLSRNKGRDSSVELIYTRSCERMVKLMDPSIRNTMISNRGGSQSPALTSREVALVRGTCEHTVEEEEVRIEHGMGILGTIVNAVPMLGLLGTVWGVLDAFATMGVKQSMLLSEIAPAISSALVTTVVGLLVAIPSTCFYNNLAGKIRQLSVDMEGFAEELLGRIACEYQQWEEK